MPLTEKGQKILSAMKGEYGQKKGESVFYASQNSGRISGTEKHKKLSTALGKRQQSGAY